MCLFRLALDHSARWPNRKESPYMSALPKRKIQQGRRNRRRSHLALKPTTLVACPQCKELRLPHHVCPSCGTYNGIEVIEMHPGKTLS